MAVVPNRVLETLRDDADKLDAGSFADSAR